MTFLQQATIKDKIVSLISALNDEFAIKIGGEWKYCEVADRVESFLGILVTQVHPLTVGCETDTIVHT